MPMCVMRHQINATNKECHLHLKLTREITKITIQSVGMYVMLNVLPTLLKAVHRGGTCANHQTITNQKRAQHAQTVPPAITT